ncbi:MAG: ribbon-helix-helix domain-containing protein [Propionibacteriaceae bacterium]|jgi:hypothetical protein|nr:ribbon-helix-helix domain-containing protein [Propionibacteriaceae bacterium]
MMSNQEYVPATPEEAAELEALADRFEQGWTLEELRAMPTRGRPLQLGDEPGESITVRILPAQRQQLDELAARRNKSRSAIIREALDRELAIAA